MEIKKQNFEIRPYTRKELRAMYGVSVYVFRNLLKPFKQEMGTITGKYLNVNQVELIIKKLGMPKIMTIE